MQPLLDTVRSVARGGDEENVVVSVPRETPRRAGTGGQAHPPGAEGARLAARGFGDGRIGEGFHLSNVYEKPGVHSRDETVGEAVSEGWISSRNISRTTD